jgi:hypothetical protein
MESNQTVVSFLFQLDAHVGREFKDACENFSVEQDPESLKNEKLAEWMDSVGPQQFQLLLWSARREVAATQWKELTGGAEVPVIPPVLLVQRTN